MAATRKALAYSKRKPVVNTRRSKKQQYSYIKAVPPQKIVKFNMGSVGMYEDGKFPIKIMIVTEEDIQIRDLALEAVRQAINKELVRTFVKNFYFRCNIYPHNILRNNRCFSGGSKGERIQTGMKKSFGSPEGRAAIVKKGHAIFTAYFAGQEHIPKIRYAFTKCKSKLPCKSKVSVEITKTE